MFFLFQLTILIACYGFGYLIYGNFFANKSHSNDYISALSFALALPVFATIHFINFLLGWNLGLSNLLISILIAGGLFLRIKLTKIALPSMVTTTLGVFILFNLYNFLLVAILPNYFLAYTYDWRLYYPNATFYLHHADIAKFMSGYELEYLIQRTPFFSLINAFFLSFSGDTYYFHQITSTFLNSLMFWPIYLIAKECFGKKTAFWALLLLPLMPILMSPIAFPIPKPFVFFYILLAYITYNQLKKTGDKIYLILLPIIAVTSYMIHPLTLFYLIWIAVDQLYCGIIRKEKIHWKLLLGITITAIILVLPWYSWAFTNFGWDKVTQPPISMRETVITPLKYITTRFLSVFTSGILPLPDLFFNDIKTPIKSLTTDQITYVYGNFVFRCYLETFLFGFGIAAAAFFTSAWIKFKSPLSSDGKRYLWWAGLGALTCIMVDILVEGKGQAFNQLGPLVIVFYIFLCSQIQHFTLKTKLIMAGVIMMEFILIRVLVHQLTMFYNKLTTLLNKKLFIYLFDVITAWFPYTISLVIAVIVLTALGYVYLLNRNVQDPSLK